VGWVEARNPTSVYSIILLGFASLYPAYKTDSPVGWAQPTIPLSFPVGRARETPVPVLPLDRQPLIPLTTIMAIVTIIGLVAAGLTTSSFIPQALKIIKDKETRDISLLMYILLDAGIFLWFIYGLLIKSMPVVVANGITLVFTTLVLLLKLKMG